MPKHTAPGLALALLLALGSLPATAQAPAMPAAEQSAMPAQGGEAMTEGEIRKVDKDAAKLTIKHGPLENLGMPAMTMVYRVKDPAMLEQVKPGDKVRFVAEEIGGLLTVTRLESRK